MFGWNQIPLRNRTGRNATQLRHRIGPAEFRDDALFHIHVV